MSAIANFKKRRLAEKAKQNAVAETGKKLVDTMKGLADEAKETTAIKLLAQLLGCDESKAIETAQEYVEQNIKHFDLGFDPAAPGEDKTAVAEVTLDESGNIENIDVSNVEDATDELNESINTASNAAGEIENAADKASDAASDLAYQADDINAANSDLKDTVEELKKPSAAQEFSNSKSKTKQKNSSKK
jgi:methyl-accepting chemotaxis protein